MSIVVAAKLPTAGGDARQRVIDHLIAASKYTKENEPGVLKYMICLDTDPSNDKDVWAIEEYASQAVLDEHMATEPVKAMVSFMSSNPTVLREAPTIRQLGWVKDLQFVKNEALEQTDPFIIFGHIEFTEGKRDETLPYWEGNVKSSREEKGTFVYGLLQESGRPDDHFTLEVYESEDYLKDVHIPAAAIQETIKNTGHLRKNLTLAKLKLHGGYICK